MKNCGKLHPLLSLYAEEHLSPAEMRKMEEHLKACAEARAQLDEYRRLREALVALPEPKLPQGLHEKIMARVQGHPVPLAPRRPFWFYPVGALAAASLAILVLVKNPDLLTFRGPPSRPEAGFGKEKAQTSTTLGPMAGNKTFQTQREENVRSTPKKPAPFPASEKEAKDLSVNGSVQNPVPEGYTSKPEEAQVHKKSVKMKMAMDNLAAKTESSAEPVQAEEIPKQKPSSGTSFQGTLNEEQKASSDSSVQFGGTTTTASPPAIAQAPAGVVTTPAPSVSATGQPAAMPAISAALPPAPTVTPLPSWGGSLNPSTSELKEVVTDPDNFQKYWQTLEPGQALPTVDFTTQAVVVLLDEERPTAGYSIHVANLEDKADQLVIHYKVEAPAANTFTAQVLTRPWVLQIIPKPSKPVVFQKD